MTKRPAVFFDRDGTLMEEVHYCRRPSDVHVFFGVAQALRSLREAGFACVLITNQSGIGRGIFSLSDYEAVHREFLRQIEGQLDGAYMCPDPPSQPSHRRKPNTGMLEQAAQELDLDLENSWFVGDKEADLLCGRNAKLRTILVRTGYGALVEKNARYLADAVCNSVSEAAKLILKFSKKDIFSQKLIHPVRTWIEVDEKALRHNGEIARKLAAPAGLLPILKADAYGHGALRVALALRGLADIFGVACLNEAIELQNALNRVDSGWKPDILLLSPCLPEERLLVIQRNFIATVSSLDEALEYANSAKEISSSTKARIHFKIDTGMGRLGAWREEALEQLKSLRSVPHLQIEMISTHLSVADEDEVFTLEQLNWFLEHEPQFRRWFPDAKLHALNSAGVLQFPQYAFDLVRPGLMLYGISPFADTTKIGESNLKPALQWYARVLLIREHPAGRRISYGGEFVTPRKSRIAILSVGYADGYFRQIRSGTASVLIRGQRCPVVGRITMDQIMVDVTDLREAQIGDIAVLIGRDGKEEITATEFATWASTISWHVFTSFGPRVARYNPQRSLL